MWRVATEQEIADYLSGYISDVDFCETCHGLLIRTVLTDTVLVRSTSHA